ncbi:MAG: SDR family NAD(P)-dependent oxidoreductase [Bacteroidota bacterium]|nr:SDR family NAD(P)-dependent oxidoreductase [Bacteroidota bacterium]
MSKLSSSGSKVIIIGATSGIGRELATIYAKNGYFVGITGRRNELLLSLQNKFPKNIVTECFDVTQKENIPHLQSLIQKLDGVNILIYNSGYGDVSNDLEWDIEKHTTDVNVNGFVEIVCYAFNYFVNQGHGQIACTSSIASIRGNSHAPAYSASKAFEGIYMEGLYFKAKKLKKNIAITDIQPGFVDTGLAKGGKFWIATPQKAAQQMYDAIKRKKKRAYITKRWWIVATLLKWLPNFIIKRFA